MGMHLLEKSLTKSIKKRPLKDQKTGSIRYSYREDQENGEALPLVVVLHGCNQTHRDIMNDTRFNDLAEAEKFIVVYPFITSYDGLRYHQLLGILV